MKLIYALAGMLALALCVDIAVAQTAASAPPLERTFFDNYVVPFIGTIVTVIVGWLAAVINKLFGLQMEAKHRDALQAALTNAAALAAQHGMTFAVNYVKQAVPDAVKKFGLDTSQIALKVEAKKALQDKAVPSLPVAPAPGP